MEGKAARKAAKRAKELARYARRDARLRDQMRSVEQRLLLYHDALLQTKGYDVKKGKHKSKPKRDKKSKREKTKDASAAAAASLRLQQPPKPVNLLANMELVFPSPARSARGRGWRADLTSSATADTRASTAPAPAAAVCHLAALPKEVSQNQPLDLLDSFLVSVDHPREAP
jgi:hypothetical protein